MAPRKVFISYRSVDRERVRVVAEALNEAGVEVWWDTWEIQAGDNFVTKINQGLSEYDCGVVFLSNESLASGWQWEEITVIKNRFVNEGRPLIPLVLDLNVKVPPILGVHSRLLADQIPELVTAIEGRSSKPARGKGSATRSRVCFSIVLRELPDNDIGVSAQLDGKPLVPEVAVRPDEAFRFSYNDFLRKMPSADRSRELQKLGDAIGRVVFVGEIGRELGSRISEAPSQNQEIELWCEAGTSRLLSIPFEAARLADGRIPALIPGVFTARYFAPGGSTPKLRQDPPAGPLRVLVGVGAPDEGKTSNSVLDGERELQTILDSLESARRLGNAYVRVLEVGSPDEIGKALRQQSYHVLHLSGHGNKGVLELENEDGEPVPTDAGTIAEKIRDSGHSAPLVFLAACHGGLGDQEKAGFAQGLLESGVPSVLAMQTTVSDWYATELAGKFYAELSRAEQPLASRALAWARRTLEEERRKKSGAAGIDGPAIAEYATASLFLRGTEQQLLDRGLEQVMVQEPPAPASSDAVPMLKLGELVGRRRELREVVRVLTSGQQAGAQILGTGGVGKSSIAGRVMQRMAERGWRVATVSGVWNLGKIATALGVALWKHPQKELSELAGLLNDPEAPDNLRLEWLKSILLRHEVLLVLDNFEDVLTPAGNAFRDPVTEQIFALMLGSAQCGKLLITCRFPVPSAEDYLYRVDLGPLSRAEVRKLMLRHPGLAQQSSENVKQIERAIGGHPRTLEYLDALLRNGKARAGRVQERLRKYAAREGVSLEGSSALDERMQDAIRVAAADAMVEELVQVIGETPGDLEVLWQASVFPFAVPEEALTFGKEASDPAADRAEVSRVVNRLVGSSLLALLPDRHIVVHRWTAESLKAYVSAEGYRACCLRAAEYLAARPAADRRQWVADLTESIRLFLGAQEFDRAAGLTWQLLRFLQPYGQTTVWTELVREVSAALPVGHGDRLGFLGIEGDGLRSLGFTSQAQQRYAASLEIAERLVKQEPARADYLRDLSVSYDKMGDLQRALGQGETARQFYEKALEIAERLVEQEPGRADSLHDLSVSYDRMGDLQSALGQAETARQFYEKALELRERLVEQEPGHAVYLRDLSVSYNRMGDLQSALGRAETARQFYEKDLEIAERLVEQEPGRADYLRDLSASYSRMGNVGRALGQGETARRFYEKALEIAERLVEQEPGHADYWRDLSVSYEKMGDLQSTLGQGEMARQFNEKALELRERLVEQEPGRADHQVDLTISLARMGDSESLRRAFEILTKLKDAKELMAADEGLLDYVKELIQSKTAGTI